MSTWFHYNPKKFTHEEMHRVDIRYLKKQGHLAGKNQRITTHLSWANYSGETTGSVKIEVYDEYMEQ